MEYRNLGRTGLRVSELCMGTMQFGWTADEQTSHRILQDGLEAGINFIDTANIYSRWVAGNPGGVSEGIIGRWLTSGSVRREEIVLATKVRGEMGPGPNEKGLSRAHILSAVEDSLRRLKTDYIDLYQSHFYDESTPIEETMSAFDALIRQGKVRYIGCSNYPAWRLMAALWTSDSQGLAPYVALQPHYNLVHRREFEQELAHVCRTYGLGVIPYSPLAGGFLTGKYTRDTPAPDSARAGSVSSRYFNDQGWAALEAIRETAAGYPGATLSQIALAWLLADPVITSPIIGPRTVDQLKDNLAAAQIRLTPEDRSKLNAVTSWQ